jgi:hypothetical protein
MLFPDASVLDTEVDYEGDGPLAPEVIDNDDPSPRIPPGRRRHWRYSTRFAAIPG